MATIRLSAPQRKWLLLLHIVAVGAWLGLDVVVAVLVFAARGSADPQTAAFCFRAYSLMFPPIVSTSALLIATVLSVFKPWDRTRRANRAPARTGAG